jgi:nitric oxide dioxygenase
MTPNHIRPLQASFERIALLDVKAAHIFYNRLFQIAPELRPMFKQDINSQARKFIDTLALIIGQLRYSEMLHSTLKSLGERHAGYGVQPDHYDQVGKALI